MAEEKRKQKSITKAGVEEDITEGAQGRQIG